MGKATGQHFNNIATQLIPTLLSLTNVTIGVVSQSGVDCISSLIKCSRFDYRLLFQAVKESKNEARRVCAAESINSILSSWPKEELDRDFLEFLQAIKTAVCDANSKTREQGRFGLSLIVDIWPKNVASIAEVTERSVRNVFIREFPDSLLSKEFMPAKPNNPTNAESPRLSLSEHIRQQHILSPPRMSNTSSVEVLAPTPVSNGSTSSNGKKSKKGSKLRKPTKLSLPSSAPPPTATSHTAREARTSTKPKSAQNTPENGLKRPQNIRDDARLDKLLKWTIDRQSTTGTFRTIRHVLMESPTMRVALGDEVITEREKQMSSATKVDRNNATGSHLSSQNTKSDRNTKRQVFPDNEPTKKHAENSTSNTAEPPKPSLAADHRGPSSLSNAQTTAQIQEPFRATDKAPPVYPPAGNAVSVIYDVQEGRVASAAGEDYVCERTCEKVHSVKCGTRKRYVELFIALLIMVFVGLAGFICHQHSPSNGILHTFWKEGPQALNVYFGEKLNSPSKNIEHEKKETIVEELQNVEEDNVRIASIPIASKIEGQISSGNQIVVEEQEDSAIRPTEEVRQILVEENKDSTLEQTEEEPKIEKVIESKDPTPEQANPETQKEVAKENKDSTEKTLERELQIQTDIVRALEKEIAKEKKGSAEAVHMEKEINEMFLKENPLPMEDDKLNELYESKKPHERAEVMDNERDENVIIAKATGNLEISRPDIATEGPAITSQKKETNELKDVKKNQPDMTTAALSMDANAHFYSVIVLLSTILVYYYYSYTHCLEDGMESDNSIEIYYEQLPFEEWVRKLFHDILVRDRKNYALVLLQHC